MLIKVIFSSVRGLSYIYNGKDEKKFDTTPGYYYSDIFGCK